MAPLRCGTEDSDLRRARGKLARVLFEGGTGGAPAAADSAHLQCSQLSYCLSECTTSQRAFQLCYSPVVLVTGVSRRGAAGFVKDACLATRTRRCRTLPAWLAPFSFLSEGGDELELVVLHHAHLLHGIG